MARSRTKVMLAIGLVALTAAGAVLGYVLYVRSQGEDVRGSPTVEFHPEKHELPPPRTRGSPLDWPAFGYGPDRRHVASVRRVRPPFKRVWVGGGNSLLEFPPTIGYGRIYSGSDAGVVRAMSTKTGRSLWVYHGGRCSAASPTVGRHRGGTVYQTFLGRLPCTANSPDGEVVALNAATGKARWRRHIGPTESSPLVAAGRLFVGDWLGDVYALDPGTGRTVWRFRAGGQVKDGMAVSSGRVFFGAYDGHLYALRARDGRLLWRASTDTRVLGHGTFYSTPAVAYGRVYIGSTDGKVYSFGATTGRRIWSQSTGSYVYSSPAVWQRRVFAGSYDQSFYAFDAATGDVLWRFATRSSISGSPSVVDGIVYFSALGGRTYGLDARTGRLRWTFSAGKYAGVVAARGRLYAVGYGRVYAFAPRKPSPRRGDKAQTP